MGDRRSVPRLAGLGLVSPKVGDLIERHGGRPVLMGSAALMAVGLLGLAVAPNLLVFVPGLAGDGRRDGSGAVRSALPLSAGCMVTRRAPSSRR